VRSRMCSTACACAKGGGSAVLAWRTTPASSMSLVSRMAAAQARPSLPKPTIAVRSRFIQMSSRGTGTAIGCLDRYLVRLRWINNMRKAVSRGYRARI
jgi:hypothetical protein